MLQVSIGINPHWYSQFWIKQFWQLWRQGEIKLRPLLGKKNPYASFYFEVDGKPCLIDVHDKKEPFFDPGDYYTYFKAQFSPDMNYPSNVKPCWNGTTLKRENELGEAKKDFDLVFISSISGGRYHKAALFDALARLPLKSKLTVKLVSDEDRRRWGDYFDKIGVEVIYETVPYKDWLAWNKKGRWCVLTRGKHDCLSFKMLDYMSIGAAVLADYTPTSRWPVPVEGGKHFIDLDLPHFAGDEMEAPDLKKLRAVYRAKVHAALPLLQNNRLRTLIGQNNYEYFTEHIADGRAARYVLTAVAEKAYAT